MKISDDPFLRDPVIPEYSCKSEEQFYLEAVVAFEKAYGVKLVKGSPDDQYLLVIATTLYDQQQEAMLEVIVEKLLKQQGERR